ncbi:MAG: hypothetical protein AAB567_02585 [Patescibacteria group bacterium]
MEEQGNPSILNQRQIFGEGTKMLGPPEIRLEKQQEIKQPKKVGMIFLAAALLFGAGIYAWQSSISKVSIEQLTEEPFLSEASISEILNSQNINSTESGAQNIEKKFAQGTPTEIQTGMLAAADRFLKVVVPNGGEIFCIGDHLSIQWEQKGIQNIRFYLHQDAGMRYDLGVFSAGFEKDQSGDLVHIQKANDNVAVLPSEGSNYRVTIGDAENPAITDMSDAVFTIKRCGQ